MFIKILHLFKDKIKCFRRGPQRLNNLEDNKLSQSNSILQDIAIKLPNRFESVEKPTDEHGNSKQPFSIMKFSRLYYNFFRLFYRREKMIENSL